MVYYLEFLTNPAVPEDWPAFWGQTDEMLEFIRNDLLYLRFETKNEALLGPGDDLPTGEKIRYRKSDDRENLVHFWQLSKAALREVAPAIERREWTPQVAHHWAVLMFCHGFLFNSAFALGDDLNAERAGEASRRANSRDPQVRWVSHYFLRELGRHGSREKADEAVKRLVDNIIAGEFPAFGAFDKRWFQRIVNRETGDLTQLFKQKYLSRITMESLVNQPTDDLPPTDLQVPDP